MYPKIRVIPHGMQLKSTKPTERRVLGTAVENTNSLLIMGILLVQPESLPCFLFCLNPHVEGGYLPGREGRSIKWGEWKPTVMAEPSTDEKMDTEKFNSWKFVIFANHFRLLCICGLYSLAVLRIIKMTLQKMVGKKIKK